MHTKPGICIPDCDSTDSRSMHACVREICEITLVPFQTDCPHVAEERLQKLNTDLERALHDKQHLQEQLDVKNWYVLNTYSFFNMSDPSMRYHAKKVCQVVSCKSPRLALFFFTKNFI